MEATPKKFQTVNEYFASAPPESKEKLIELRATIKKLVPNAEEVISYNMPAFKEKGILVYYAGYKNHVGFYPTGAGIAAFSDQLSAYKFSKGAIQFPLDKPLPITLINKIVKYRVKENSEKQRLKSAKKK